MRHTCAEMSLEEMRDFLTYSPNKEFIDILEAYKQDFLPEPEKDWDLDEFKRRVYERTAIDELEALVRFNPDMDLIWIIWEFMDELMPSYCDQDTPDDVFEVVASFMYIFEELCIYLGYST